ncbi:MAG: LysR family transcriptional regulator [Allosphingosinicella sp.]|uniref:LysR family transcriptional regulator n=1 Tax=Allosphingosinicella sp. TaxID=2823234 RepID=UPI00393D9BD0
MKDEFSEIELRRLDLNLLLVFSALMRERSVSRASGRLFIGPSAVSVALTRLRDTLGDPLFVRAGTGMEPTPRSPALWSELELALSSIEIAVRGHRTFDPATAQAIIRFAAPDELEFVLVPRFRERLETEAPSIRLVVLPSDFRTLLGRLDSGDADLALSATPTSGVERRHRIRLLHRDGFSVLYDAQPDSAVRDRAVPAFALRGKLDTDAPRLAVPRGLRDELKHDQSKVMGQRR